jgi:hypothetical protein
MSVQDRNEKQNVAEMTEAPQTDASHSQMGIHVVRRVHADGAVDLIDAKAVGGDVEEMPAGYYRSLNFIFTYAVSLSFNYTVAWNILIVTGCLSC